MDMKGRTWFGLRSRLLVTAALLIGALALPLHASADTSLFLAEGEWVGSFGASGPFSIGDGNGSVNYSGDMTFTSELGQLTGDWSLLGTSTYATSDGDGTAEAAMEGQITGTSNLPEMTSTGGSAHVVGSAMGFPFDVTVPLGAGDMQMTIELVSASCNQAVGDFSAPANAGIEAAGGSGGLVGTWVATRQGDLKTSDPDAYNTAVNDLLQQAVQFRTAVTTGGDPVDTSVLDDLVYQAEDLSRAVAHNEDCGFVPQGSYVGLLRSEVDHLMQVMLDNPGQFNTTDMITVIMSAMRMGAFDIDTGDPTAISNTIDTIDMELQDRLSVSDLDCAEASGIAMAAEALGMEQTKADAESKCAGLCGSN